MFVKKVGQTDDHQWLSYISSKAHGTLAWHVPAFSYNADGSIKSADIEGGQSSFSYTGIGHRNGSYAVQNYVYPTSNPDTGYVHSIPLSGIENKAVKTLYPAKPAGMAYVYLS